MSWPPLMLHRSIVPALITLITLFGGKATGREVVNWSMGDACIRLMLRVGVSHGENPRDIRVEMVCSGEAESGPSIPLPVSDRPDGDVE